MFNIASYNKSVKLYELYYPGALCGTVRIQRYGKIALVCKICFEYKKDIHVLTENKSLNFLLMFSQPSGIPDYFEWLDYYIILTSVTRLLNIAPIFSIYSFIIFCSSYITLIIRYFGLGIVIFSYVSWFFWLVFDCLLLVVVIEAYDLSGWTCLVCIYLQIQLHSFIVIVVQMLSLFSVMLGKSSFVNPYKPYSLCCWLDDCLHTEHLTSLDFSLCGQLMIDWSPAHLTYFVLQMQKFFVWPYLWQLMHWVIWHLGYGGSNLILQSRSEPTS